MNYNLKSKKNSVDILGLHQNSHKQQAERVGIAADSSATDGVYRSVNEQANKNSTQLAPNCDMLQQAAAQSCTIAQEEQYLEQDIQELWDQLQ